MRLLDSVHPLQLAAKHRATKFLAIVAESCIEGYPDRNVPTVFVYRGGAVTANIVGLADYGGMRATDESEWRCACAPLPRTWARASALFCTCRSSRG